MSFSRVLLALPGGPADDALEAYVERLMRLLPNASLDRTRADIANASSEAPTIDADLVVMSPLDTFARHHIGEFVMRAPCSVWVVPPQASVNTAKVLVPVDLTEGSAETLAVASHLVRMAGGERCEVLHVLPVALRLTFEEDADPMSRGRAERALATFIARVDEEGIEAEPLFVESANAANAIVRVAQERTSDLIVMTTRGRTRLAARLLPSVCQQVIRASPTPVLAIKHRRSPLGAWEALRDRRVRERGDLRFN